MATEQLFDTKHLVKSLKKAEQKEFNFAFMQGPTPEDCVLVVHHKMKGKKLLETVKSQKKELKKGTYGVATTSGKVLKLKLEKKLGGAEKTIKEFLRAAKDLKQNKLELQEADGAGSDNGKEDAAAEQMNVHVEAIRKAVTLWDKTTDVATAELGKLLKALKGLKNPLADKVATGLEQALTRLDRMDDEAEAALAAAESGDPKAFNTARKQLLTKIKNLTQFVNSDEMLKDADENPITKTKIRDTLNAALQKLVQSLK